MPPRLDRRLPAAAVLLAVALAAAAEGDAQAYLDPSPENSRPRVLLLSGGLEFPISGSQGVQPQLAAYLDLPRNLQAGLKARVDVRSAMEAYDYIPQTGIHLRQLWLSDQDSSTVSNSEYISLAVGAYPAYDFQGEQSGLKPFAAVILGKYWMPFANQPFGLDFCLEITRFFDGHPPSKPRNHFLSAGVNLFRVISSNRK